MKQVQSGETWVVGKLQSLSALFDPEILQWPGGLVIAPLLWFCAVVSLALGFGRVARAHVA